MELAVFLGILAFIILGIMFALLWQSSRQDERQDPITQEIIVKTINTGSVIVNAPTTNGDAQEDKG